MATVTFDIEYTAGPRDRLSNALRIFYAIPHLIIVGALGYFAEALGVIQWFIILFTGKRNEGLWDLTRGVLDWQARAYTYVGHDVRRVPELRLREEGRAGARSPSSTRKPRTG